MKEQGQQIILDEASRQSKCFIDRLHEVGDLPCIDNLIQDAYLQGFVEGANYQALNKVL